MNIRFFSFIMILMMAGNVLAQQPDRKPVPSADRAKSTVDRISEKVKFTTQQKTDLVTIFTKFYDDVRAQQAYRDQTKLEPLEKARDAKVAKLLNNPSLYKQYDATVKEMKAQFQERQRQQQKQNH
jgi:hypothetical protein